jgi:class 3 adenylate cyclase/predicted ATPase
MLEPSKAERRHLTVLFCDLVGSTALSERLDPEDLREVVQAYQSLCGAIIRRYDGYVAQFLGDGLLVYFGYPTAHEDDAARSVRAGLEIATEVQAVRAAGEPLQARVGIHSGLVVVGEIGEGARREQLALGQTPNFANYAQTRAAPGSVVMSEATERLVRGYFRFEEMIEAAPSRMSRPLRLFRILGRTSASSRIEAASTTGLSPFVGRTAEVEFLSSAWAGAAAGIASSVVLRGEPGIGKTRLVAVVKGWIEPEQNDLLECRCSPYYQNTALHPIIEMLERRLGYDAERADRELKILEERVRALGLAPGEAVPLLAPLFSIPLGDGYAPLDMAPTKQRQRTLELLADCLVRLAVRRPTLFIVEDLHWSDPTTVELMKMVLSRQGGESTARLMVLVTARTELPAGAIPCIAEMRLQPLAREDSKTLVSHVTGRKALPDEVLAQLLTRAGGVPLFVEEATKAILEGGAFRELDDRYELSGPMPSSVVPPSVRDSLTARIDRLGDSKPMVQLAATLGREFRHDVVKAVSPSDDAAIERDLARLVDAELLYRKGNPPDAVYTFKHALIQDAAYDSLLRKTRQEYHARIARTLAERFPHLSEAEPELLARHYEGAGLIAEAISLWQRAGTHAMARAANLEAIAHLTHAAELLRAQPSSPEALQQELAIQLARGPALMAIKGYAAPDVRESYTRAREICRELGDVPQLYPVLWGLWAYYFVGGNLGQAFDLGEQVYRLAKAAEDPSLLTTASHALGYPTLYRADYARALELAEAALDVFDIDRERAIVRELQFSSTSALCDIAGTALWVLGYPDRALKLADRGMALAAELQHPPAIAYAATAFSWGVPHLRGESAKVRDAAETVLRLSSAEEFSFWPPLTRFFLGWSHIVEGRIEAGISETQSAMRQYRTIGGGILRTTGFAIIADGHRQLGRFDEALAIIGEGLENVAASQERHYEQELYRIRGEIFGALGRIGEAEQEIQHALALTREQKAKSLELRASMSLARLWDNTGKRSAGRDLLAEVYEKFTEGFETRDLKQAKALLDELDDGREGKTWSSATMG